MHSHASKMSSANQIELPSLKRDDSLPSWRTELPADAKSKQDHLVDVIADDAHEEMPMLAYIPEYLLPDEIGRPAHRKRPELTAEQRFEARERWHRIFDAGKRLLIMRHVIRPTTRKYSALESIRASQCVFDRTEEVLILPEPLAKLTWKEKVWTTLDDPESSPTARVISIFVLITILWSCISFIVQSLPQYTASTSTFWAAQELTCIIVFTVEFLVRLFTCPVKYAFITNFLNAIDIISIVPYYIELGLATDTNFNAAIFRSLRLMRIFRLLKVSRYLTFMSSLAVALGQSIQPLSILFFIIMLGVLIFSSIMYYIERGNKQNGSNPNEQFGSIIQSMWWCVATISTVGYGDMVPSSEAGRFMAVMTSLFGIMTISVPISVVTMNFHQVFERMRAVRAVDFSESNVLSHLLKKSYTKLADEDRLEHMFDSEIHPDAHKHDDEVAVHVGNGKRPMSTMSAMPSEAPEHHHLSRDALKSMTREEMRQQLFVDIEMQINTVLQQNQEWMLENINIMMGKRRLIVRHQLELILKQIPIFYRNIHRFAPPPEDDEHDIKLDKHDVDVEDVAEVIQEQQIANLVASSLDALDRDAQRLGELMHRGSKTEHSTTA